MDYKLYLNHNYTLDISSWASLGLEMKGTRNKQLVVDPSTKATYLFKTPKHSHELFNEVFNSILCNYLSIKHVEYYNAVRNGVRGVLCKSFLNVAENEELWEMRELLTRYSNKINPKEKHFGRDKIVQSEHNIETIFMILKEEFGNHMMPKFFQMIGFDALIGHTDRHWENYGFIIYNKDGSLHYKFSPIYDTVSAYAYSSLEAQQLSKLLSQSTESDFFMHRSDKFSKISLPNNMIKINHFDLVKHVLNDPDMTKYSPCVLKSFKGYDHGLGKYIFSRYFKKLDETHKHLVLQILAKRREIGLNLKNVI